MEHEISEPMIEAAAGAPANGHVAVAERPGLRPVKMTHWFDLPDQEHYPGYRVQLWINPSNRVWRIFLGDDQEAFLPLRGQFIVAHNDWCDADGTPIPQPGEDWAGFASGVSNHLLLSVIDFAGEVARRPMSFLNGGPGSA